MTKYMIIIEPNSIEDPQVYFTDDSLDAVNMISDLETIGTACQLFSWDYDRYVSQGIYGSFRKYED